MLYSSIESLRTRPAGTGRGGPAWCVRSRDARKRGHIRTQRLSASDTAEWVTGAKFLANTHPRTEFPLSCTVHDIQCTCPMPGLSSPLGISSSS